VETLFYYLAVLQIAVGSVPGCGKGYAGRSTCAAGCKAIRASMRLGPALLCPCKGLEPGLERNLVALTEFDYRNYEIFFILASASDSAYTTVQARGGALQATSACDYRGQTRRMRGKSTQFARGPSSNYRLSFEVLVFCGFRWTALTNSGYGVLVGAAARQAGRSRKPRCDG